MNARTTTKAIPAVAAATLPGANPRTARSGHNTEGADAARLPGNRFTTEQAKRIIAACDAYRSPAFVAGVKLAALGVVDGFENAHEELLCELEAVDCHPLWVAMDDDYPRASESYVPAVAA